MNAGPRAVCSYLSIRMSASLNFGAMNDIGMGFESGVALLWVAPIAGPGVELRAGALGSIGGARRSLRDIKLCFAVNHRVIISDQTMLFATVERVERCRRLIECSRNFWSALSAPD